MNIVKVNEMLIFVVDNKIEWIHSDKVTSISSTIIWFGLSSIKSVFCLTICSLNFQSECIEVYERIQIDQLSDFVSVLSASDCSRDSNR